MVINIKLLTSAKITKNGFPIVLICNHKDKKPKEVIGHAMPEMFNNDFQMVSEAHPDYDILMPKIMDFKLKARKIIASGETDPVKALKILLGKPETDFVKFADFGTSFIKELKAQAENFEKTGDLVNRNKLLGNARVYENCVSNINKHMPEIGISELEFLTLNLFREACPVNGNSKSTVHLYLRTMRSLYNKALKIHKIEDKKPFVGVFDKLAVRSSSNKKKHLKIEDIRILENVSHNAVTQEKYVELFLLCFYFGGCDLIDVYFLKNQQIRNGRVRFMRGKTNTDIIIDLKIHPKAEAIIEKYKTPGVYLFPWRKDKDGYLTFRSKLTKYLDKVQERNAIIVEPDGGTIGIKVARHTFANIGKNLMFDADLLRELMGHERNDVDNYYKDKYPESVRDEALFKIIG